MHSSGSIVRAPLGKLTCFAEPLPARVLSHLSASARAVFSAQMPPIYLQDSIQTSPPPGHLPPLPPSFPSFIPHSLSPYHTPALPWGCQLPSIPASATVCAFPASPPPRCPSRLCCLHSGCLCSCPLIKRTLSVTPKLRSLSQTAADELCADIMIEGRHI